MYRQVADGSHRESESDRVLPFKPVVLKVDCVADPLRVVGAIPGPPPNLKDTYFCKKLYYRPFTGPLEKRYGPLGVRGPPL